MVPPRDPLYRSLVILIAWLLGCIVQVRTASAQEQLSESDFFESLVRPLLLDKCMVCHSRASGRTSGGLALDTRDGWLQGGDSGPAIVPGNPELSLLIQAVDHEAKKTQQSTSPIEAPAMPPLDEAEPLSPAEITTLRRWVERGAFDPRVAAASIGGMTIDDAAQWWAFQPLKNELPPAVRDLTGALQPVDSFLQSARELVGIQANPIADKRTLIRRVALDLTGLPPTIAETDDFLNDDSPMAWQRVVDRLLSDPAYGERWGRHWLDVARYADTAGDGADYPIPEAGLYRDWVIQSFNRDQPFDEFVREQIAGDIIAAADSNADYANRVTATGFLAIGKRYGYAPNTDFQHLDFADCIDSVGRSLLGLSIGCARCHDHKYDPITTEDYYALYGVLQSSLWSFPGGEELKRPAHFVPLIPRDQVELLETNRDQAIANINNRISELRSILTTLNPHYGAGGVDLGFESQAVDQPPNGVWLSAGPNAVTPAAQSPFADIHAPGNRGVRLGSGTVYEGIRYVFPTALRLDHEPSIHFAVDFRTVFDDMPPSPSSDHVANQDLGCYRLYLGRGVIESLALECSVSKDEFAVKDGPTWRVLTGLKPNAWHSLRIHIDRDSKTFNLTLLDADSVEVIKVSGLKLNPQWDGVIDTFICDGIGHRQGKVPQRDIDNLGLQSKPFSLQPNIIHDEEKQRQLEIQIQALEQELASEKSRVLYPVAYGVSEGQSQNAKVQLRGEPDKLAHEVPRRTLTVLGGEILTDDDRASGRLGLANWIASANNPLTPRVFVNRLWQWHFGQGLVTTPSDFGTRGERPSHPELLDYLAGRWIRSGWSIKYLHRQILLSRSYQLSSADDATLLQRDPTNRWVWKMSRRPLDAETVRDSMMFVTGSLDQSLAPRHPFPPTDSWAFTIHKPFNAVYESNHRTAYLMIQRNGRHPFLALFDAADPNLSVASRQPTITPTQSLYLMNSPWIHQISARFADYAASYASDDQAVIRWTWQSMLGIDPSASDIAAAEDFLDRYRKQSPLPLSDRATDAGQASQRDAWAALGRILMTSNAFLYVE